MWLSDLEQAIKDMKKFYPDFVLIDVHPVGMHICFYHSSYYKTYWDRYGNIIEVSPEGEKTYLRGEDCKVS